MGTGLYSGWQDGHLRDQNLPTHEEVVDVEEGNPSQSSIEGSQPLISMWPESFAGNLGESDGSPPPSNQPSSFVVAMYLYVLSCTSLKSNAVCIVID